MINIMWWFLKIEISHHNPILITDLVQIMMSYKGQTLMVSCAQLSLFDKKSTGYIGNEVAIITFPSSLFIRLLNLIWEHFN